MYAESLEIRRHVIGTNNNHFAETLNNLAMLLWRQGKGAEAKPFLVELSNWSLAHPNGITPAGRYNEISTLHTLTCTIACCRSLGQEQEIPEWQNKRRDFLDSEVRAKTSALLAHPSNPVLLAKRAAIYARLGSFENALADYRKANQLAPGELAYWDDGLVPLLLQNGDGPGYRRTRSRELQQFRSTTDAVVAHRVAQDALMAPIDGADLQAAEDLADRATNVSTQLKWAAEQTKAMSEYRAGRFTEAISTLQNIPPPEAGYALQAENRLFLAMAYEGDGNHAQAADTLARATHLIETELSDPEEAAYTVSDWILCQIVRREAEALINGEHPTTQSAASTKPTNRGP